MAVYSVVELPDGSWIVRNDKTWSKIHMGYFASEDEAREWLADFLEN